MSVSGSLALTICGVIEAWLPAVGYEGTYEVSDYRRVRRVAPGHGTYVGKILSPWIHRDGCPMVSLSLGGKRTNRKISNLVADAFLPPKSSTDQVLRHLNDDPTDNRIENLAWGTYSDNMADSMRNGNFRAPGTRGSAHGMTKLTDEKVAAIRRQDADGVPHATIAIQHGIATGSVSKIVTGRTWGHIGTGGIRAPRSPRGSDNGNAKLTDDDVREIRRLRATDQERWTYQALADKFGISFGGIRHVVRRDSWGHVATEIKDVK